MVEVCGVKYMEGVGKKSGKPYKGFQIYYTKPGERQGVTGFIAGDAFISCELLGGRVITVGDKLQLVRTENGYLEDVIFC